MNDSDQLTDAAIGELYSADPDVFTERRRALAAEARTAGDKAAAKQIAALAKPTRSAWVVNRLVRADPSVPARLAELGDKLRAGEAALDGASIRELSKARRDLIDALVRQALDESGQRSHSAALRDEVTDTFSAALADPDIAAQVAAGTLVKAVRWAGFGPGIGTAAPAAPTAATRAGGRSSAGTRTRDGAGQQAADHAEKEAAPRAERERRLWQAVAAAEAALSQASGAADAAAAAERDCAESVSAIEQQLTDERRRLSHARIEVRRTAAALHRARQALDRLRGQPSQGGS